MERPARVRIYDVATGEGGSDAVRAELARAHPSVEWITGANIGFAAAANLLFEREAASA